MKTVLSRLALMAAFALTSAFGVSGANAVTLQMNHQMPATAVGSKVDQWFADEIEKRTGGEVKIKIFWSEGLGKANETLSLLQSGAIDMAGLSPGYFPAQLPLFTAPNSFPMAIDSIDQASTLMDRLVREVPGYMEEARENGVRPLFFHVLNPYLLVSVDPITTLDQMQGVKMRTWGSHMPRMVQAAGGTAVTLSLPDIYEALSRGVVDAAPFAVDLVVTYNIFEVAKNVSEITLWDGPTWGCGSVKPAGRSSRRNNRRSSRRSPRKLGYAISRQSGRPHQARKSCSSRRAWRFMSSRPLMRKPGRGHCPISLPSGLSRWRREARARRPVKPRPSGPKSSAQ